MLAPTRHRVAAMGRAGPLRAACVAAVRAACVAALLAACSASSTPNPTVTAVPLPSPTPNVHLAEPATADAVLVGLQAAGLPITANTATGGGTAEPRKTISATYAGWPLLIIEYGSRSALTGATTPRVSIGPYGYRSAYALFGLNVLIAYGPLAADPGRPSDVFRAAAARLVTALDPLIGPLAQRSVLPLTLPSASPAAPGSTAPSAPSGTAASTAP